MATSTPTPDASPTPQPRQELLVTVSAQVAALDEIIALARHSIRVFDNDMARGEPACPAPPATPKGLD